MLLNKFLTILYLFFISIFASPINLIAMEDFSGASDAGDMLLDYIDPLDDDLLDKMTIDEWEARPMISGDFFYLGEHFIEMMMAGYRSNPWVEACDLREKFSNILELDYTNSYKGPLFPCIAKLVVPKTEKISVIGDIHGEMDTVEDLLQLLLNNGIMNKNMDLGRDEYLIFLGDYFDRGNFSFKVLSTILLLSIKNPGQVFMIRGNHEFIRMNKRFGLDVSVSDFEKNGENKRFVMNLLMQVYEFLFEGIFVGYSGQNQVKYQFFIHGCPDFRFDYTVLLDFNSEKYVNEGNDLCFWMLKPEHLITTTKIRTFFDGISAKCEDLKINGQLFFVGDFYGFLVGDIVPIPNPFSFDKIYEHKKAVSYHLINEFFNLFTSERYKVTGFIHGHQHLIPKNFKEVMVDRKSPGCSVAFVFSTNQIKVGIVRKDCWLGLKNNVFSVVTLISGFIRSCSNGCISYYTTFLRMEYCDKPDANGCKMRSVYDENLML